MPSQYWEVWYPKAASTGLLLARGLIEAADVLLLHAAGDIVTVEVRDPDGGRLAFGKDLARTATTPIARLTRRGESIVREDIWPGRADIGTLVLLPGGEVGRLLSWWHADDRKEWRWQVEFYNSIR